MQMNTIDFANLNFAALRASIEDEARADLLAVGCHFDEAAALMKRVNAVRAQEFGPWPIRELREFTELALANTPKSEGQSI